MSEPAPPVAGSAVPDVPATGWLLVVALVVGGSILARRVPRAVLRRAGTGLLAGGLLGFTIEAAPHLVHHALEPGQGEDCQVLQALTHADAAVAPAEAAEPPPIAAADAPAIRASWSTADSVAPQNRAPPA